MSRRSLVAKTYKLYVGGAFARSESGRSDPTAAFGGYKESGFGREGGPPGLLPYVRLT